jgi:hypothetical protein
MGSECATRDALRFSSSKRCDVGALDSTEGDCEEAHLCAGKMVTGGGQWKRGLGAAGLWANTGEHFSK